MKEESSQYCPTAEQRTLTMPMITLRSQGRSFYWAGKFLSADQVKQAAYLYTLCRHLDDIADEACDTQARAQADKQLKSLSQALTHAQPPSQTLLREIYTSARQLLGDDAVSTSALQDLIATLRTDLRQVRIGSETELLQYCYGAAGTVGVMMSCLLNAQPRASALPHAIDLGIAMQMTNIARDVLTDAHLDRIYLPAESGMAGVHPRHIVSDDGSARHLAWLAVNDLLGKADIYYSSAWQGLRYLPLRPRLAIAVAAMVYREIGRQILRRGKIVYWQQRSVVSSPRKALVTLWALMRLLTQLPLPGRSGRRHPVLHQQALHNGIRSCLDSHAPGERSKVEEIRP